MRIPKKQRFAPVLLALLTSGVGWAGSQQPGDPKAPVALPKDPKAVVLSYDPGAGGFVRKGPPPYLRIQADGQVTVTNLHDGSQKETKLTAKELDELLRFVVRDKDFFNITEARIAEGVKEAAGKGPFIAVGGAGTSVIAVQADGKKHEVSYRAAAAYLQAYPKVEMLARFAAVEKRLADFAAAVAAGKQDEIKKEMARLQGEWSMVSGEIDGQAMPAELIKGAKRTAKDDETTVTVGGQLFLQAKFTIDPSKKPKTIDYTMTGGPTKGKTQLGIYEITGEGETVKFCFASPGKDRPTDFTTTEGSGRTLSVWTRDKQ